MSDRSPWHDHVPLRALARRYPALASAEPPTRDELGRLVAPDHWQLVAPSSRAHAYEHAIAQGCIPTRDRSWHDAFNVIVFAGFPVAKRALHARVAAAMAARARTGPRSREEDALALLDETAVLVVGDDTTIAGFDAARAHADVDGMDHALADRGCAFVFGHALLEHLVLGRHPIGAGVCTLVLDRPHDRGAVDLALAGAIAAGRFAAPCFAPTVPWPEPRVEAWCHAPDVA
ncbi:MAG: DUF3025 domain-containing protein [Deltaproteobacteria bacterium]|nr:DUF3025 domain-containing protein [Deltaproteobacteria bacterium]